jgi:hypothetical protein
MKINGRCRGKICKYRIYVTIVDCVIFTGFGKQPTPYSVAPSRAPKGFDPETKKESEGDEI